MDYHRYRSRTSRLLDEAVERRERFLESISPENKWLTMMRAAAGMTGLMQELVDAIVPAAEMSVIGQTGKKIE